MASFAHFGGSVWNRQSVTCDFFQCRKDIVNRSRPAPAHVVYSRLVIDCECKVISPGTVTYIDEIPRLISVSIDDHLLTRKHFSCEYSHNTRLTMWILPGPENIGIAKHCILQTIVYIIHVQIMFNRMLAGAVWADRVDRMRFITWKLFWFAVCGSASRNVEEALYLEFPCVFDEVDRTEDINICVKQRLGH